MDTWHNDGTENVEKIHKTISMKQPQWGHGGFTHGEKTARPVGRGRGRQNRCQHDDRGGPSSPASGSPIRLNNEASEISRSEMTHESELNSRRQSPVTEQQIVRNKGRRPDVKVYVPRAKRAQHDPEPERVSLETKAGSDEGMMDADATFPNKDTGKPPSGKKCRQRPTVELYVPRNRRMVSEDHKSVKSETKEIDQRSEEVNESWEELWCEADQLESKQSLNLSDTTKLEHEHSHKHHKSKKKCGKSEEENASNDSDHHKSKRKHHKKNRETKDSDHSGSRDRKEKHRSKHRSHDREHRKHHRTESDDIVMPKYAGNIRDDEMLVDLPNDNYNNSDTQPIKAFNQISCRTSDVEHPVKLGACDQMDNYVVDELVLDNQVLQNCAIGEAASLVEQNGAAEVVGIPAHHQPNSAIVNDIELSCNSQIKQDQKIESDYQTRDEVAYNETHSNASLDVHIKSNEKDEICGDADSGTKMEYMDCTVPTLDSNSKSIDALDPISKPCDVKITCEQVTQVEHFNDERETNSQMEKEEQIHESPDEIEPQYCHATEPTEETILNASDNIDKSILGKKASNETELVDFVLCTENSKTTSVTEQESNSPKEEQIYQSPVEMESQPCLPADLNEESIVQNVSEVFNQVTSQMDGSSQSERDEPVSEVNKSELATQANTSEVLDSESVANVIETPKDQSEGINDLKCSTENPEQSETEMFFTCAEPKEAETIIEDDDESWDKLYDDSGEALNAEMMEELTAAVGKVQVQKTQFDYLSYQPKDPDLDYDSYSHLIEIYDFPSSLVTRDLIIAFKQFQDTGFDIKWVDDNHAIGIFSSASAARSAVSMNHPLIKVRSLSEATRQTKVKAKKACEFLQPYRPRPETVASVARNMVAGALGLRSKIPKEKREEERRKIQVARDKKKQSSKEKKEAWNGSFGRCAMDDAS